MPMHRACCERGPTTAMNHAVFKCATFRVQYTGVMRSPPDASWWLQLCDVALVTCHRGTELLFKGHFYICQGFISNNVVL